MVCTIIPTPWTPWIRVTIKKNLINQPSLDGNFHFCTCASTVCMCAPSTMLCRWYQYVCRAAWSPGAMSHHCHCGGGLQCRASASWLPHAVLTTHLQTQYTTSGPLLGRLTCWMWGSVGRLVGLVQYCGLAVAIVFPFYGVNGNKICLRELQTLALTVKRNNLTCKQRYARCVIVCFMGWWSSSYTSSWALETLISLNQCASAFSY